MVSLPGVQIARNELERKKKQEEEKREAEEARREEEKERKRAEAAERKKMEAVEQMWQENKEKRKQNYIVDSKSLKPNTSELSKKSTSITVIKNIKKPVIVNINIKSKDIKKT